jgi:hypothetical protein
MVSLVNRLMPVCLVLSVLLMSAAVTFAQEQAQPGFLDIEVSKDELYSYKNLSYPGDFSSLQSPSGTLALGRTTAGVTVVIILGTGSVTIEAPEAVQEKFKQVMGGYPLKASFKSVYIRLHPKEFDAIFGAMELAKVTDPATLKKAEAIFEQRFLTSYHAGTKAILPPPRTRVFDIETSELGMITTEEGYWVTLRRLSPYGSVYPASFVNPKRR